MSSGSTAIDQFAVTVTLDSMDEFAGPSTVMAQEPAWVGLNPNETETAPEGKEMAPPGACVLHVASMKTTPFVPDAVRLSALGAGCGLSSPGVVPVCCSVNAPHAPCVSDAGV